MAADLQGGDGDDEAMIAGINVTPFVDVVLVLLIILMVTSTQIVRAQLNVDLPEAASAGAAVPSTLNLVLTREGTLYLDGTESSFEALGPTVQRLKAEDPDLRAVISADQGVAYGQVVRLIDSVKTNGVKKFALNIDRPSEEDAPPADPGPAPAGGGD